jgi:hypothetical protein
MSYVIVEKDYRSAIVGILVSDASSEAPIFVKPIPGSPTPNKVLFDTEQQAQTYIHDVIGRDTTLSFYRVFKDSEAL